MEGTEQLAQELIDKFVGSAHGNFDAMKELLAEHPSLLNALSSDHETALQAAAHTGQKKIAEHLLEAGAPLDVCAAALLGKEEAARSMLEQDASLISATGSHNIPLMFYVGMGSDLNIAELVLEKGADLNAGDGIVTGLHGAILSNSPEMLTWLLEHGARPDLHDHSGKTALDWAVQFKRPEMERALNNYVGQSAS